MSVKSPDAKLEFVIEEKLSNSIISLLFMLCADAKVIVTVADPLVVENALVKVVVALIAVSYTHLTLPTIYSV